MGSPWKVITIVILYLYFVEHLGPRLMKKRPPFNVEPIIKVYNLAQIFICAHIIYRSHALGWLKTHSWYCQPIDYSNRPMALQIAGTVHMYVVLKFIDLVDTIFFVLRKKFNQVSFLHVYHHAIMSLGSWFCMKILPGGHAVFLGYLNSWVHVFMYTYYFITSMWPEYKKNIWWKKHITQLQMFQFFLIFVHGLIPFFIECEYPRSMAFILSTQAFVVFSLFFNFYVKTYMKAKTN
ncbi:very long chain fatty acid elongase 7-like isoform X2 [Periplaneta americana]